jgi:hypothetical protein
MKTRTSCYEPSNADLALQPDVGRSRITSLLGMSISFLVLVVVAFEHRKLDVMLLRQMLPTSVGFWLVFAVNYLSGPIGDWIIFRRLWRIPWTGLGALLRKLVTNEIVFGYLGEAQFYAWARTNTTAAPFGAIKDVALLSALVGNVATLVLLACTWPVLAVAKVGIEARSAFLSVGMVLLSSLAMVLFRQKLFTLPRGDLRFVATIHAVRSLVALFLSALLWHLVLPQIAVDMWLVLSALRMLVSRLPFVPNTDILFAGVAVLLLGHEPQVGALMAMIAAVTLATHVIVGASLAIADLLAGSPRQGNGLSVGRNPR